MAHRKITFMAALGGLFAPAWAQLSLSSLPRNCYYTSTVIFGGQSGFQTFSSMSSPIQSSPSDTSNTFSTASSLRDISSSISTVAISSSSTSPPTSSPTVQDPLPTEPFFIQAIDIVTKAKRAIRYTTFVNGFAILVDVKDDGSLFILSPDGYLLSGDFFVGPAAPCLDSQSCSSILARAATFPDLSVNEWNSWTVNGSSVSFGDARFCVGTEDNLFLVFGDGGGNNCVKVLLVPEPAPTSSTSSSATVSSSLTTAVTPSVPVTATGVGTLSNSAETASISSSTAPSQQRSTSSSVVASSSTSLTTEPDRTSSSRTTATPLFPATPSSSSSSASPTTTVSSAPTSRSSSSASSSTQATSSSGPRLSSSSSSSTSPASSSRPSSPSTSLVSNTSSSSFTSRASSSPSSSSISFPTSTSTSRSSSSTSTSTSTSNTSTSPSFSRSSSTFTSTTRTSTSTTSSTSPSASPILPGKRGLSYSNVNLTYLYPPPTQVSWTYNYYYAPNSSISRGIFPHTPSYPIRFIPLLFNDDGSLANEWPPAAAFAINNYGADALFSFNEPDLCVPGSACMTVARALTAYNRSMQPFATSHPSVRLVAPSITNAGSGFLWLREFLGNATLLSLKIDIINIHWYASPYSMEYFAEYMQEARVIAGNKPIWITEYGMDRLDYYEPHVLQFIRNSTYWCDQQPWIERYAWFGNYVGNLVNNAGTALSQRGVLWHSYNADGYVYGWPPRLAATEGEGAREEREVGEEPVVAGSVGGAKALKEEEGRREVMENGRRRGQVDATSWSRGWFADRLWWKQDGHMDGK